MSEAKAIVTAMAAGMREALGAFAGSKLYGQAASLLEAQCRHLAIWTPGVHSAVRELVEERVASLVTSADAAQEVMDHPREPNHAYFLLIVPDVVIRRTAAHRTDHGDCGIGFLGGQFSQGEDD